MKLYDIRAKRKGTDEPWTEWTRVYDFKSAVKHLERVKQLGYEAKIVEVIYPLELLREFVGRLKEELSKTMIDRDIHDEEKANLDSDAVWDQIDVLLKEFEKRTDIYLNIRLLEREQGNDF